MTTNDFRPNDVLQLTRRNRNGVETHRVVVTIVDYNGNGLVTYAGDTLGQGAFDPQKIGAKPFGLQSVEKIGREPAWRPFTPRPGDRAYDLMC